MPPNGGSRATTTRLTNPTDHDHQATNPKAEVMVPRRADGMVGRSYLDAGDRLGGRFDPPRLVTVLARWGPGGGPRNVLVRYADDGLEAVIPFPRRLRRADTSTTEAPPEPPAGDKVKLSGNCARCTRRERDRRRRQATRETPEIGIRLRAQVQALGRRVGDGDPADLALLVELRAAIGDAERMAVAGLRAQGHSDAVLGRELGVSKQAVAQRWARDGQP